MPTKPGRRTHKLSLALSTLEKKEIEEAAGAADIPVSDWIRRTLAAALAPQPSLRKR